MPYHDPYLRTITGTLIIHKVLAGKKAFWQASAQYKEPPNDRFGCQASAIRSIKARQGINAQQKVKKSFFGSSLIDKVQKNDFSTHRSSTMSQKIIFRPVTHRQRAEKRFFCSSLVDNESKNRFSALCRDFFNGLCHALFRSTHDDFLSLSSVRETIPKQKFYPRKGA